LLCLFISGVAVFKLLSLFIDDILIRAVFGIIYQLHPFILAQYYEGHVRALFSVSIFPLALYLLLKSFYETKSRYILVYSSLAGVLIANGHPQFVYIEALEISVLILSTLIMRIIFLHNDIKHFIKTGLITLGTFLSVIAIWSIPYSLFVRVKLTHAIVSLEELQRNSWGFLPAFACMPGDISFYKIGFNINRIDPYLVNVSLRPLLVLLPVIGFSSLLILNRIKKEQLYVYYSLLIASLISVLFSVGYIPSTKIIYELLMKYMPYFYTVRFPQRWSILTLIIEIVLGAITMDYLMKKVYAMKNKTRNTLIAFSVVLLIISSILLSAYVIMYPPRSYKLSIDFQLARESINSDPEVFNVLLAPYGWTYQDDNYIYGIMRSPFEGLSLFLHNKSIVYDIGGVSNTREFLPALGKSFEYGNTFLTSLLGSLGVKYVIVKKFEPGISSAFNPAKNWYVILNQYNLVPILKYNNTLWILKNPYYKSTLYSSPYVLLVDKGFLDLLYLSKIYTQANLSLPPIVFTTQLVRGCKFMNFMSVFDDAIIPILHINNSTEDIRDIVLAALVEKAVCNHDRTIRVLFAENLGKNVLTSAELFSQAPYIAFQTYSASPLKSRYITININTHKELEPGEYMLFLRLASKKESILRVEIKNDNSFKNSKIINVNTKGFFDWIYIGSLHIGGNGPITITIESTTDLLIDSLIIVNVNTYKSYLGKFNRMIMNNIRGVFIRGLASYSSLHIFIKLTDELPTLIYADKNTYVLLYKNAQYITYPTFKPLAFIHYLDKEDNVWKEYILTNVTTIMSTENFELTIEGVIPSFILNKSKIVELYITFNTTLTEFVKPGRILLLRGLSPIIPYNIFLIGLNFTHKPIEHAYWNDTIKIVGDKNSHNINIEYFFKEKDVMLSNKMCSYGRCMASIVLTGKPVSRNFKISILLADPNEDLVKMPGDKLMVIKSRGGFYNVVIYNEDHNGVLMIIPAIALCPLKLRYISPDSIEFNSGEYSCYTKNTHRYILIVFANAYHEYWNLMIKTKYSVRHFMHIPIFGAINGFIIETQIPSNIQNNFYILFDVPYNIKLLLYLRFIILALFVLFILLVMLIVRVKDSKV
jgi:hypothetical protein